MKTITLNDSIDILKKYLESDVWGVEINFHETKWCFGEIPKEYRKQRNSYEAYADMHLDIDVNQQRIINIASLADVLKKSEKVTGWICQGFCASDKNKGSITLHFENYHYLKP